MEALRLIFPKPDPCFDFKKVTNRIILRRSEIEMEITAISAVNDQKQTQRLPGKPEY